MTSRDPVTALKAMPPAMALAKIARSAVSPKCSCAPPRATRNPVMTSSNTSSAPCVVGQAPEHLEEPGHGRDEAPVDGDRFAHDRRHLSAMLGQDRLDRRRVVPLGDDHVRQGALGDARRSREPSPGARVGPERNGS